MTVRRIFLVLGLFLLALMAPVSLMQSSVEASRSPAARGIAGLKAPTVQKTVNAPAGGETLQMPLVMKWAPWAQSPFGIETIPARMSQPMYVQRARELGAGALRLRGLSWRLVQPTEAREYRWADHPLASNGIKAFEADLLAAAASGHKVFAVVQDSPNWAFNNVGGNPTSCGAIAQDRFDDFAAFMAAAVERYSRPPFNVMQWELGNEVDIDPRLVPDDAVWGCWGNIDDPYYGGEYYGEMLKVVGPAIRAANPNVKISIGGLIYARPEETDPNLGHPERFLEGILRAGAAPHFDVVPYHGHSAWVGVNADYSGLAGGWEPWGPAIGKATLIQQTLANFGVSKEIMFHEGSLGCEVQYYGGCASIPAEFLQAQANHVPRMMVRALSAGVTNVTWFTLGPDGWRSSQLMEANGTRRPSFYAYQNLIDQVSGSKLPPVRVNWGVPDVEAYRFNRTPVENVDVLWATGPDGLPLSEPRLVSLPADRLIAAYDLMGNEIAPVIVGGNARFLVGFEAIYVHWRP